MFGRKLRAKRTKFEDVLGVGQQSITNETFANNKQATFYGGIAVTQSFRDAVKASSISDYISSRKLNDGSYRLRVKFPEKGFDGTNHFHIRKNLNLITKGLAQLLVDKDGHVNLTANYEFFRNTVSSLMDPFTSAEDKDNIYKQFAGYKNLSSAEKKDFLNFLKIPNIKDCLWQIVMRMQERAANLASYKYCMDSKQMNAEHQHVLQDSYIDYENSISALQALSQINVDKETNIYAPINCNEFATLCDTLMLYTESERAGKLLESVPSSVILVRCEGDNAHFSRHVAFGKTIQVDGQDCLLTLECTGAPQGKALFHPEKTNTGIGCYENEAAWEKQFLEDDKQVLSSFDHYNEIVSYYRAVPASDPLKTKPCMANSATNLYYKMYKEGKNQNNSDYFTNVMDKLQTVLECQLDLKDCPTKRNAQEHFANLKAAYLELEVAASIYIENRKGAHTLSGKTRLKMMTDICALSKEKTSEINNLLKEPVKERVFLAHSEERKNTLMEEYNQRAATSPVVQNAPII